MKIIHVAESAQGGVGSYLSNIAPLQFDEFGAANVHFVAPRQHRDQLANVPNENLTVFDRDGRSMGSITALIQAIRSACAHFQPDVIHAHSTFAGLVVRAMYAYRRGRPAIVYCPHGWAFNMGTSKPKQRVMELVERGLSRWCDSIIAISDFEAAEAGRIGIAPSRVRLVPNGVPETPEGIVPATWNDPRLKVLFVGRLDRQKGVDLLLEAIKPLEDKVSLRIAGAAITDGEALDIPASVDRLGWLDQNGVCAQLAAADIVVVPSRWEGFGLVAVEAMRARKPVAAFAVGGLSEIVDSGVTGWLLPGQSPVALREALAGTNPAECRIMGEAGRRRYLDRFTADKMNRFLTSEYRKLHCQRRLRREDSRSDTTLAVNEVAELHPMGLFGPS